MRAGVQARSTVVLPNVRVGNNVVLKRVVIDRGCEIEEGMEIGGRRFHVTGNGITLVTPDMHAGRAYTPRDDIGPANTPNGLQNDANGS